MRRGANLTVVFAIDATSHIPPPISHENMPTLGILGGGQLGRMTALAAIPLGIRVRFLVPATAAPVSDFADVTVGDWTDPAVLRTFAEECDAVTVESEWAPADRLAEVLPEGVALWPSPETLVTIRDKARQKAALQNAGLPVAPYALARDAEDAAQCAERFGYPVVLKQRRGSYDGYGNTTVRTPGDLADAFARLADGADDPTEAVLVEAFVPFARELAVMVARSPSSAAATYPVAETEQRDHRCHSVVVPAGLSAEAERAAQALAVAAVEAVGGVGVTGVELFELADGTLLVNELAPRPHNTGHYTIEACHTSQFENHARAVLGWPLGDAGLRVPAAAMVNVLGGREGALRDAVESRVLAAAKIPGAHLHLYGKADVRPKRKMGHVTVTADTPKDALERAETAAAMIAL